MSRSRTTTLAAALLLVTCVMALTDGQLGVVTTYGTSMEPVIHQNDLVIIGRSRSYGPGDIVAYPSAGLADKVILHRVVDRRDGLLTTKGDNNTWIDSDRPREREVLGKVLFRLPGWGGVVGIVRRASWIGAAAAAALLASALSPRRGTLKERFSA